jgi:hypothetical protein
MRLQEQLRAAEDRAAHLQGRLVESERRAYELGVDRDALRQQVDQLTYQLFAMRGARQAPPPPSDSEWNGGGVERRRIATLDASTLRVDRMHA